jgi:hypothetical protein
MITYESRASHRSQLRSLFNTTTYKQRILAGSPLRRPRHPKISSDDQLTILLRCSLYCQGHPSQPGSQCSALCINFLSGGLAYAMLSYGYRYPANTDCILMILRFHAYSLDKSHGWIVSHYHLLPTDLCWDLWMRLVPHISEATGLCLLTIICVQSCQLDKPHGWIIVYHQVIFAVSVLDQVFLMGTTFWSRMFIVLQFFLVFPFTFGA